MLPLCPVLFFSAYAHCFFTIVWTILVLWKLSYNRKTIFGHFMSINGTPRKNGKNAALQRSAMFIENISTYSRTPAECYV